MIGNSPKSAFLSSSSLYSVVLDAAAASNSSQAVVWIDGGSDNSNGDYGEEGDPPCTLIYSSQATLHLATREEFVLGKGEDDDERSTKEEGTEDNNNDSNYQERQCKLFLWRRQKSLRASHSSSSSSSSTATDEVITCLAHVKTAMNDAGGEDQGPFPTVVRGGTAKAVATPAAVAVGYSSGRIMVWMRMAMATPPNSARDSKQQEQKLEERDSKRWSSKMATTAEEWIDYPVFDPLRGGPERISSCSVTVLDGLWICDNSNKHDSNVWMPDSTLVLLTGSSQGGVVHVCRYSCQEWSIQPLVRDEARDQPRVAPQLTIIRRIILLESPLASVHATSHEGDVLLLLGTASPRHNKIHVFQWETSQLLLWEEKGEEVGSIIRVPWAGALSGHQDWVTCLDWKRGVLASGSKDCKIRLWSFNVRRLSTNGTTASSSLRHQPDDTNRGDNNDDDDETIHAEDDDEEGESRLDLVHRCPNPHRHSDNAKGLSSGGTQTSVLLDALLFGHESAVTSVQWHPDPAPLFGEGRDVVLLSAGMDRTILLWSLQHDDDQQDSRNGRDLKSNENTAARGGMWVPFTRLGVAGGILGGPVGSSLLGFCRATWEPRRGQSVVGHAYGGALHVWSIESDKDYNDGDDPMPRQLAKPRASDVASTRTDMAVAMPCSKVSIPPPLRWQAMPGLTGHFGAVTDVCWERSRGSYLLTVSADHTCRLWAPMNTYQNGSKSPIWAELARPQVHGYGIMSVTSISTKLALHRLVTAADEKELRVFDAPLTTIRNLERFCGVKRTVPLKDPVSRIQRAFIPSLGLTNKSSAGDDTVEEDEEDESQNLATTRVRFPLERDLGVVSVWPESNKLFGHTSELICVTSAVAEDDSVIVASSTKARDADAATIRIWEASSGACVQTLTAHKSTVVTMSFSRRTRYLVSSGRDRGICLWEKQNGQFSLSWSKDSAHKRIVWSVHFSPCDETVFASGSRDGSCVIWKIQHGTPAKVALLHSFAPTFSPLDGKPTSVTALAFAPIVSHGMGYIGVGLESGLIEIWTVAMSAEGSVTPCIAIPTTSCHSSSVTKLAWRPDCESNSTLYLASCSSDHGCKVLQFQLNS